MKTKNTDKIAVSHKKIEEPKEFKPMLIVKIDTGKKVVDNRESAYWVVK